MDDTIAICLTIIMIRTTQYNEIIHYSSLHFSRLVTKSYPVSLGFFHLTASNCIIIVCTKVMYLGDFPNLHMILKCHNISYVNVQSFH